MYRHAFSKAILSVMLAVGLASGVAAAEKTLRIVPQADLKILDPIWTTALVTRGHGYMIYDTLYSLDADGNAQPQMVESETVSPDLREWTFTLREGMTWHDGAPVTANDVIASLTRWGQRDGFGRQMFAAVRTAEALDAKTFRLTFSEPFGMVRDGFAKPSTSPAFIMPERVANTPADQQISDYTGSGPFIFLEKEYRPGERAVYVKNTAYKPRAEEPSGLAGGKHVHVDRVEWIILRDIQAQINALRNGEVDLVEQLPADHYEAVNKNPELEVVFPMPHGIGAIVFNHLVPPFNDPKIRRAAMLSISQQALLRAQAVHKDLYRECLSIVPCGSSLASDDAAYFTGKPQFEKAKELLKEAGYDKTPVVVLHPTDLASITKFPQVYAQLLRQAGFVVDLQSMDWSTLQSRRRMKAPGSQGGWGVFITNVGAADIINPLYSPFITGNGEGGFLGWPTDEETEKLKKAYVAADSQEKRAEITKALQLRTYEAGLYGPIGEIAYPSAVRKGITGVLKGPANVFWNIRKD